MPVRGRGTKRKGGEDDALVAVGSRYASFDAIIADPPYGILEGRGRRCVPRQCSSVAGERGLTARNADGRAQTADL